MKLLAIFRGSDGRSLALALAFLLVATGGPAGLSAPNPSVVLCTIGDHPSGDKAPLPGKKDPCCTAGCTASPGALHVPETLLARTEGLLGQSLRPLSESVAIDLPQLVHGPRGPPTFV
jgi:hypothetical protein